ncbi:MAG: hypothetical protein AAF518_10765 [Spirochaetota bacterium]
MNQQEIKERSVLIEIWQQYRYDLPLLLSHIHLHYRSGTSEPLFILYELYKKIRTPKQGLQQEINQILQKCIVQYESK